MDREEYQRLIARMREAVEQTQTQYHRAKEEFYCAMELELPNPDGRYALDQALIREQLALGQFRKAVFDFNRLVLDGEFPDHP